MAGPDFGIFYHIAAPPCGILKQVAGSKQMLVDVVVVDGQLVMTTTGNMITHYEDLRDSRILNLYKEMLIYSI